MANSSSPLDSCANYTRGGGAPAPDHDAGHAARTRRLAEEQARLVEWAQENCRLRSDTRVIPEFARGGEHGVHYNKGRRRYFKATLPDRKLGYGIALGSYVQGAVPSEYLDRLSLPNHIFRDDIRLEFIQANRGTPIIFTSQPAIRGINASPSALDAMMVGRGYQKLAEGAYYDGPKACSFSICFRAMQFRQKMVRFCLSTQSFRELTPILLSFCVSIHIRLICFETCVSPQWAKPYC